MKWLKTRAPNVKYRICGMPVSFAHLGRSSDPSPAAVLRRIYARNYWRIRDSNQLLELAVAVALLPIFVFGAALWHCARNGPVHARRSGRPILRQFVDQLKLYAASGVMPASYYIFGLHDEPTAARARSYLKRAETKGMFYVLVRKHMKPTTSLNDKVAFEQFCVANGLPVIPTLGTAREGKLTFPAGPPKQDIFIKPLHGKGGRGAERWEWTGRSFRSASGEQISDLELCDRIMQRSRRTPLIIQPRIRNHRSLADLNCGALTTIRVLTCNNEAGEPEIVGAALRMAVRSGSVVDNLHGGGIASAVDLESGELGPASDLGKDARIGWLDRHPASGAQITGRMLEQWPDVVRLALDAQRAFADRLFVGWDIALGEGGPIIVEGNSSPDLDILQRTQRRGMGDSRFAALIAARLQQWEAANSSGA